MSADALATALARIAALESRLAAQPSTPQPTGIDQKQLVQALVNDPAGTLQRLGVSVDHVSRVLVAHALGDSAPPEMRVLAQQGPLMSATQALASDLQSVRQRLESFEERDRKEARRTSFSALATDKTKYPTLAAVIAKDPSIFTTELDSHQGDTAALADSLESRLKVLAPALGVPQPASNVNAETQQAQSQQGKQAQPGAVDPTPPAIPKPQPGVFTQETHEEVKARVLRKYGQEAAQ